MEWNGGMHCDWPERNPNPNPMPNLTLTLTLCLTLTLTLRVNHNPNPVPNLTLTYPNQVTVIYAVQLPNVFPEIDCNFPPCSVDYSF